MKELESQKKKHQSTNWNQSKEAPTQGLHTEKSIDKTATEPTKKQQILQLLHTIVHHTQALVQELEKLIKRQPTQKNHSQWLDTPEVVNQLHVSARTIQRYRSKGILPYTKIEGKIYYKQEEIEKILENRYRRIQK
ncbi:helix-turn-helix domain-containing protein [Halosquirtibacter laminarini]|uniref:Helix-turn-helix domain-containing protein n=1 Tax=Halosquirtibacter laminarini TaxID=3374600 RepID=A0AC61NR91_9BACT|nr:helix-turn-helix domain-containing protein [Prolixibacteraceae bacterium]